MPDSIVHIHLHATLARHLHGLLRKLLLPHLWEKLGIRTHGLLLHLTVANFLLVSVLLVMMLLLMVRLLLLHHSELVHLWIVLELVEGTSVGSLLLWCNR